MEQMPAKRACLQQSEAETPKLDKYDGDGKKQEATSMGHLW